MYRTPDHACFGVESNSQALDPRTSRTSEHLNTRRLSQMSRYPARSDLWAGTTRQAPSGLSAKFGNHSPENGWVTASPELNHSSVLSAPSEGASFPQLQPNIASPENYGYPALQAAAFSTGSSHHTTEPTSRSSASDSSSHLTPTGQTDERKKKRRRYVPHVERKRESVIKRNARERKRMGTMTTAFRELQLRLPILCHMTKRIPKEKILSIATSYIQVLRRMLDDSEGLTSSDVGLRQPDFTFLPPSDLEDTFSDSHSSPASADPASDSSFERQVAVSPSHDPDIDSSPSADEFPLNEPLSSETDPNWLDISNISDMNDSREEIRSIFSSFENVHYFVPDPRDQLDSHNVAFCDSEVSPTRRFLSFWLYNLDAQFLDFKTIL